MKKQPEYLTLEERFALAATTGLLSAQLEEPDPEWVADWVINFAKIAGRRAKALRPQPRRRQSPGTPTVGRS
jgi:hypothetical protein